MDPVEILRGLGDDAERLFPEIEKLAEIATDAGSEEMVKSVQEIATYFAWVRQSVLAFAYD